MAKRYGIFIKGSNGKDETRWYSSPGKRRKAMSKLRHGMIDDPNCKDIRFVEGECLKLGVTYRDKDSKVFEFVSQEELAKARTKIGKDRNVTSTYLVV